MADPAEILRIAQLLETIFLVRKVPIRKAERELGLSNGYLARIFNGKIELKYRHILDLLEVAGMEPGAFFQLVYPHGEKPRPEELVQKLSPVPKPQEMTAPDSPGFELKVVELLVKLGVLAKAPAKPRPPQKPGSNQKTGKKPKSGKNRKPGKDPANDPKSK